MLSTTWCCYIQTAMRKYIPRTTDDTDMTPEEWRFVATFLLVPIALVVILMPFFAACSVLLHLKDIKQSLFAIHQTLDPPGHEEKDDPQ